MWSFSCRGLLRKLTRKPIGGDWWTLRGLNSSHSTLAPSGKLSESEIFGSFALTPCPSLLSVLLGFEGDRQILSPSLSLSLSPYLSAVPPVDSLVFSVVVGGPFSMDDDDDPGEDEFAWGPTFIAISLTPPSQGQYIFC